MFKLFSEMQKPSSRRSQMDFSILFLSMRWKRNISNTYFSYFPSVPMMQSSLSTMLRSFAIRWKICISGLQKRRFLIGSRRLMMMIAWWFFLATTFLWRYYNEISSHKYSCFYRVFLYNAQKKKGVSSHIFHFYFFTQILWLLLSLLMLLLLPILQLELLSLISGQSGVVHVR